MDTNDNMNDPLNRLMEAARAACPPVGGPSPWFEQRVLLGLREETPALRSALDGSMMLRSFAVAAVVAVVSAVLPVIRPANPYLEAFDANNSVVQRVQAR